MAILPIIVAPDPRLNVKSAAVERVDADIARLMDDMLETMYDAPGIGLAAPQVGVPKRVIVIDTARQDEPRRPVMMANPELLKVSDAVKPWDEGCLSLPEHYAEVIRPAEVTVRYLDHENKQQEIEVDGAFAVCVQHEMDHLEGTLFVEHISALKRGIIMRKLRKAKKQETLAAE